MKNTTVTNKSATVLVVGCVLLLGILYYISKNKNMSMNSELEQTNSVPVSGDPMASSSSSEMNYASANGIETTTPKNMPSQPPMGDPSQNLPRDANSQWASLPPSGNGALQGVNLLQAGSLIGINTQGSSFRNANLQLRSEVPIPKSNVSPWMNSTIEPDLSRKPLEIGSSS
jgi:hypothetical protein